ncbi:procathepsin L-like [Rhinoraja longicauda]
MELSIFVMFISSVIVTIPATPILLDAGLEELTAIPNSINWNLTGYVTDIKDQGRCGACWAFTAIATVEAQIFNKTNTLLNLSEQNLLDCAEGLGCRGGWVYKAYQYIRDTGIANATSYPYIRQKTNCSFDPPTQSVATISGYRRLKKTNETIMMELVAKHGPISVAIHASKKFIHFEGSDIFDDSLCNKKVNHAVTVIGYVNTSDEKYWIIKNSWGTRWGIDGFVNMVMGKNMCGITTTVDYPVH